MKTAVLIPCLDEAVTIGKVIDEFRQALPEAAIHVYDNGSDDDTVSIARKHGAMVGHESNKGKGNVVRTMLEDVKADVYVMVDGDDTYPAESAPIMIGKLLDDNLDMVVGDRLSSTYFRQNDRPGHGIGNRLVRWAINRTFHSRVNDVMSGYRVFTRRFADLFTVIGDGFELETEMTVFALSTHMRVAEVPVEYRHRPQGSSSKLSTVRDGVIVLRTLFRLMYEHHALLVFCASGVLLLTIGIVLVFLVFMDYWHTGYVARFPTLIGSIMLMIVGVVLVITGLVFDTMNRKSMEAFHCRDSILSYLKNLKS